MSCLLFFVTSLDVTLPRNWPRRSPTVPLGLFAFWSRLWPRGSVRRRRLSGVPFLLDLAEVPDRQGNGPCDPQRADDHAPGLVDVEVAHERPEPAVQPVLLLDEAEDLDGTDEEGNEHGQTGDGQVVVDLPDGPCEGPVVGEVHEAP